MYMTSPTIEIASIFPFTLKLFAESFGGKVKRRVRADGDLRKTYYHFRIFGEGALDLIRLTLPYLHEKKQQAELVLLMRKAKCGPEREGLKAQLAAMKRIEYD